MDEQAADREADGDTVPDSEPRSYDPTDENSRPPEPSWDSWADPPGTFPEAATQVFEPLEALDHQPIEIMELDDPEVDPDATQQWNAFAAEESDPIGDTGEHSSPLEGWDESNGAASTESGLGGAGSADEGGDANPEAPTVVVDLDRLPGRPDDDLDDDLDAEADQADHVAIPEVEKGQLIADRFRLEEELAVRTGFLTWRAFDVKLSRPVLVHLLHQDDPRSEAVLLAARDAATATDSAFLRVLDAATATDDIAYVVCEYVSGKSLEKLLAEGPLSGLEAAWVLREVARAMAPMHAKGLFHLRLNPDTVIISSTGNVRLVGFLIDAALTPEPGDQASNQQRQEADVHAMGQLLYAMLVSRWPVMPDETLDPQERRFGLALAPMDHEGWLTPRQVRAGVSPALDQLCDNVLHAQPRLGGVPLETASAIDEALERVLGTADASSDLSQRVRQAVVPMERTGPVTRPAADPIAAAASVSPKQPAEPRPAPIGATPEAPRERPAQRRIWLRLLLALIAIVLISSLVAVAVRQGRQDQVTPSPTAPATPVVHPIAKLDDFDPEDDGGNSEENPNAVANAWDKKPDTAWTTLTYLNNPKLGGLKPGVGLVVDLGQAVDVGSVKLTMVGSPTAVQVMVPSGGSATVTAAPMNSVKSWTAVASSATAGTNATFTLKQKAKTRYLLVYLTSLPQVSSGKFRGGIAEIEVTS